MKTFEIIREDRKTNARIGILRTKKGKIETPFFMPVATKATVKYVSSLDLNKIKAKALISNSLILLFTNSLNSIKSAGGIGSFMKFRGINVTDSGGFQMYSKNIYLGSNENGVFFINPINGEKIFMTPEKNMELQYAIGGEVAMCLDSMPLIEESRKSIEEAVKKTTLWAKRCKIHHDLLQTNVSKRQLLFGITQGGIYSDLREKSAKEISSLNFDGYAIGGLALGETKEEEYKMIKIHKKIISKEKPTYLMGAGNPVEILESIALGVDMFDSRFPTRNARHGTLFSYRGFIRILNKKYEKDNKPIDENCDCIACKNYSKSYIRYLLREEEGVGFYLATVHNISYLCNLFEKIKDEIKKGTFLSFKEKIKKIYAT